MLFLGLASFFLTHLLMPYFVCLVPPSCYRENYEKKPIPQGLGFSFVLVTAFLTLFLTLWTYDPSSSFVFLVLLLGFSFLGLLDDFFGEKTVQGFFGHFRMLYQGRLTTGTLKALGGGMLCLFVAYLVGPLYQVPLNALLLALSANLCNLLDVRPGRCGKFFLLATLPLILQGAISLPHLVLWFSFLAYFPWDLKAKGTMGDVGANSLGAILGLSLLSLALFFRVLVLLLLLFLHIRSERMSLSVWIETHPLLSWLDRQGR